MEDNLTYFFGAAVLGFILILYNHIRQKSKLKKFIAGSAAAQPVFLQQAVERKLIKLRAALQQNMQTGQVSNLKQIQQKPQPKKKLSQYTPQEIKQLMIQRLELLEDNYASGKMNLETYNDKLHEMVEKLNLIK